MLLLGFFLVVLSAMVATTGAQDPTETVCPALFRKVLGVCVCIFTASSRPPGPSGECLDGWTRAFGRCVCFTTSPRLPTPPPTTAAQTTPTSTSSTPMPTTSSVMQTTPTSTSSTPMPTTSSVMQTTPTSTSSTPMPTTSSATQTTSTTSKSPTSSTPRTESTVVSVTTKAASTSSVVPSTKGTTTLNPDCPPAFTKIGRACYSLVSIATGYSFAEDTCRHLGAGILWLESKEELEDVNKHALENGMRRYWIGLRKVDGVWSWSNGMQPLFLNWRGKNEPDNCCGKNVSCAIANYGVTSGEWDDTGCDKAPPGLNGFICKLVL